ncbi:hypothetical protein [Acetobacter sp.]|uniref:hypothetical protein n=1 Tax=Acetobacter sp. TaxID=440 RepID=UPI0039E748AA
MNNVVNYPAQSGASRSYLAVKDLTKEQCRFILSIPISGEYGIPKMDRGSIRASLILMGYVAAGFSARWGSAAARLTRRGCIMHRKLISGDML